ncbi:MAG: FecR family protein, partial [Myxococcaceae bacterium]
MTSRPDPRPTRLKDGDPAGGDLPALLARAVEATREPPLGARERIWRSVEGPRRAAPRRWAPALVPGFGFALAAIVVFALRPPPEPPLRPVSPAPVAMVVLATRNAWVERPGGEGGAPAPGELLAPGTKLLTGSADRAGLRLEQAGVLLGGGSRATLHAAVVSSEAPRFPGEGGALSLSAGRVVVCAARSSVNPLSVAAGSFLVEGSRADFEVRVAADRTLTVLVHDGSAQVRGPSAEATVRAGESWSSLDGPGHAAISEADLATARWLRAAPGEQAAMRLDAPAGTAVEIDGVALGPAPLKVLAPVG